MPYDPDTDPDTGSGGGYSGATSSRSGHLRTSFNGWQVEHGESEDELGDGSGHYHDYDMRDEPRDDGDDEDDQHDQNDEDEMEIDPPRANLAQTSIETPRPPPQPSPRSFAPINSLTKTSHVAVVLHSSPRKSEYVVPPEDDPSDTQDLDNLVTSDLIPGLKPPPKPFIPHQQPTQQKQQPAPSFVSSLTPKPKKRGRPFGWKIGSGPYTAPNSQPGAPRPPKPKKPPGEAKRRGRPPKAPSPEPRQIFLSLRPKYVPFYCEWANCPAELQNLETLRRHLFIVHGDSETCQWSTCAARAGPPVDLPTDDAFREHVDKAHLLPFVWHVGDGPRNSSDTLDKAAATCMRGDSADPPLPGYLFDAAGKQVTPSIREQEFENDEERKRREKRLHRCLRQQQLNAPMEPDHSEEFQLAMTAANEAKRAKQKGLREYAEGLKKGKFGVEWRECLG